MSDFIDCPIWAEPFIPRPARDVTRSSCPDVFVRHEEALDEAKSLAELCERSFSGPLLKTEEVGLFRIASMKWRTPPFLTRFCLWKSYRNRR